MALNTYHTSFGKFPPSSVWRNSNGAFDPSQVESSNKGSLYYENWVILILPQLDQLNLRQAFGTVNLGSITGLIVMIHHMCGGLGAWIGAAIFDARGGYDAAFGVMFGSCVLACLLTLALARR